MSLLDTYTDQKTHTHTYTLADRQTDRRIDIQIDGFTHNPVRVCVCAVFMCTVNLMSLWNDMDLMLLQTLMNFCAVRAQLIEFNRGAHNNE